MNDYLVRILTKEGHICALTVHYSCSRETIERVLVPLGREELSRMIAAQDQTEVRCEFRGRRYLLTRKELMSVFERRGW